MPSGRSHDAVTILLAAPFAVGAFALTRDLSTSAIAAVAFIFAGVMFGPDLDTRSRQYSRWGPVRLLWLPYRTVFRHRSRWSHGLIFGTLFRVVYFLGAATLTAFIAWLAYEYYMNGGISELARFFELWSSVVDAVGAASGISLVMAVLIGMWAGAASHTLTDVSITYIKTGRVDALF